MKWLEISVQCDGEAAEAVAELFNRFNSSPGQTQGGAVVEIGGFDEYGEVTQPLVTVKTYLAENKTLDSRRKKIEEGLWFLSRLYPIPNRCCGSWPKKTGPRCGGSTTTRCG